MGLRVICYCRCSTDEQANHGVSLVAQAAKLASYAQLFDLEIIATINDAGESAKSLKRPGIQRALAMLRSGQADGICVTKLDRLTRSVVDWQTLIDGYFSERVGKQLFSLADSIDTRTASGRMVLSILMVVSQAERELIGERTSQALQYKISKGERCGNVRFGYRLGADGRTLEPVEDEQRAIKLMGRLRSEGKTYRAIAAELTRLNIAPKQAATWSHAAVRQILCRKVSQAA